MIVGLAEVSARFSLLFTGSSTGGSGAVFLSMALLSSAKKTFSSPLAELGIGFNVALASFDGSFVSGSFVGGTARPMMFTQTVKACGWPLRCADSHAVKQFHRDIEMARIPFRHFFVAVDLFHNELIVRFRINMSAFTRGHRIALTPAVTTEAMDPLTTSAANGMRARLESLDLLANNIANSSAPGFKADREFFGTYLSQEAAESPDGTNPPILPVIERNWTDFAQGSMTPTGGPLDVALNGKGFFVATSPSGAVFTRDGSFRLSKDGQLETLAGYPVQGTDGKPIVLDKSKPVDIGTDGTVRQGGQAIGQIAIVDFQDPTTALTKRGSNYFRLDVSDVKPDAGHGRTSSAGQAGSGQFSTG